MSEELRDILTRQAGIYRLKFLSDGSRVTGNLNVAQMATINVVNRGIGIFIPQAVLMGCYDSQYNTYNPGPKTFTYVVKNMQNKVIFDAKSVWNYQQQEASNNALNYYDNFDSCVGVCPADWYVFRIFVPAGTPSFTFQPYFIGTEFLI
jgi:hypothetical protein